MTVFPSALLADAEALLSRARERGARLATAESCTGGLVAALLTEIAGSSVTVDCGFVTYSNEAKTGLLGVPPELIEKHGAVSEEVAAAMAEGALSRSQATLAVSITGIAGPGGGSPDKPVGLVHFACAQRGGPTRVTIRHFGDPGRSAVRIASVRVALALLNEALDDQRAGAASPRP